MENEEKNLSWSEKISYGMGDCGTNVTIALCSTFLTTYYTDMVGIVAAAVDAMMLLTRVFNGVTDIIMGAIVDRTKSKQGKARPWVLWTASSMAIALILELNVSDGLSGNGGLVYAHLTYVFQNCIMYAANNLPFNALLSRTTPNIQDRASVATTRFIMTQLTTLIINTVTAILLSTMGQFWLSLTYRIVTFIMCLIYFLGIREHIGEDTETGMVQVETVPLKLALSALLKNRYFYIQSLLFMFLYIGAVGTGSTALYFCDIVLNNLEYLAFVSMAIAIPTVVVNFILPGLIKKFGKWKLVILGAGLMAVGSTVVGVAGSDFPLVLCGLVIKGTGMGPIMSGIFAMTTDVVDCGEWKTGTHSEGLTDCCTSFGMRVGIGLGSALCTLIITMGGYDGTAAVQSESAVNIMRFRFGYSGAIITLVCLALCRLMNIDKYIVDIQRDLEAKRETN